MQGYGPRRTRFLAVPALVGLVVIGVGVAGCGLSTDTRPSTIVVPPTDVLSTESQISTTSATAALESETPTALPSWTIGRVIAMAPRAANSRYRQGSTSPGSPVRQTSGYHFSTPDRTVNCSTGDNDRNTLACRMENIETRAKRPSTLPSSCDWSESVVVLDSSGSRQGACTNEHPVLYRSAIVDYGDTISVGRFSCLVQTVGLYCLESRSRAGFSLTATGYAPLRASDRAPGALVGPSTADLGPTLDTREKIPEPGETTTPTR